MLDRTKVTIFAVAERSWGWLITSAEVDDTVYVGPKEWRVPKAAATTPKDAGIANVTEGHGRALPK